NHDLANKKLVKKLQNFIADIKMYQIYSQSNPVYQLIDKFYHDHYVIQYFSGLIGGKGRRANLYGLFNKAIEFENSSFRGLYQFIRFIDELIDRGQDFGEENIVGPNDNVVKMMTIHSSKGLEFPFVIYSGLTREFNKKDLREQVILNQKYGLGIDYYDIDKNMAYPSLSSVAYKAITEKEMISEEMRLIYVALTRAKEQLILIGRLKSTKKLEEYEKLAISGSHIAINERLTAEHPFELIYGILSKHKSYELTPDLMFENDIANLAENIRPNVNIIIDYFEDIIEANHQDMNEQRSISDLNTLDTGNDDIKAKITQQLKFKYPNVINTTKPSKQSVSELKRQLETEESNTNYDRVRQYRIGVATYERPRFMRHVTKRKANEVGTLMHTVMQHLPFKPERMTEEALEQYIDHLITQQIIEHDAKKDIKFPEIMTFIQSDLYLEIAEAEQIYRELPFVVNQAKVDNISDNHEDVAIIQGMIDLIYKKDNQYYFVDYKTDAFNRRKGMTDEEIGEQLKEKYRIQMQYYKNALETMLHTEVKGSLYFFQFGRLSI
ncbi:MAG: 3'-5' exonuclease, partial [Staphylococcus lugdunensis]|nr:3'-5' exonuclease [Staphylococcus lugdunensis]